VYGVVKQHGGEILVYSEPGEGTVFKIYLPAVAEAVEPLAEAAAPAAAAPVHETVLLVEDEEQVRTLTRTMLERQGYRVLDAASGAAALELLRQSPGVDLLLTDVVMAQMRGPELAVEVKALCPGIKVLFMSGYTEIGVLDRGVLSAGAPFLQKPFSSDGLQRKVREVLQG
jgi:CheY-like chemotaxis protein